MNNASICASIDLVLAVEGGIEWAGDGKRCQKVEAQKSAHVG